MTTDTAKINEQMAPFRQQIDAIDAQIISILAKRFDVVKKVAEFKATHDIAVVQPARAQAVKDKAIDMAAKKGLSPDLAGQIWDLMISHAHALEADIIKKP